MNINNWGLIVAVLVWGLFYAGPRIYTLMVQYAVMKAQLDATAAASKGKVQYTYTAENGTSDFNFDPNGPYA